VKQFLAANPLLLKRFVGKSIDMVIVIALASLPLGPAGPLAAFIYILISDGIKNGQSFGKRVVQLRVKNTVTGELADLKDSVIRNSPVAIPVLFSIIPIAGWILAIVIGIPILAIEVYLMTRLDQQARLGDTMADTKVEERAET
jgi:hypothetical protein